ncbi:MAG: dTDP-4-dehydrorhamnose reductase [Ferrimonas sp.]
MKILITGKGGQLAYELSKTAPEEIKVASYSSLELDITDSDKVLKLITTEKPDIVINAAAYTAVDQAESDQKMAFMVNENGTENLALACKKNGSKLIHISTDFIFSGAKSTPYKVTDNAQPVNVYGKSKLAGEQKALDILESDAIIIRTAWVYSSFGKNFVKTMLNLMNEKAYLNVVSDQIGTPTWANGLAKFIWSLTSKFNVNNLHGIFHWTDSGIASWYDFAIAIQELSIEKGLLNKCIPINPIQSANYPTPAERPKFTVLDKFSTEQQTGIIGCHWRIQLSKMLDQMKTDM